MKVSLNLIKQYVALPKELTSKQIAYDLTLRTVEVESVENTSEKYHDIVVGKILEIRNHPNADLLKICITDITAVQNDNEYLLNHICPLCERQKNTLCKKMTNLSLNHHILWLILVFTPYYAIINNV